ncbi:hypothetical protein [Tardiphaga sp. 768_D3_N2_1]|uniref:hypothetical protein n=1 Tax=Tardiphaga sp. 768_D3_N2_1 TaxID=3240783 RepID=UPI003F89E41B
MLAADLVFACALVVMIGCNLYVAPRIPHARIAMQWGFDGKPTWDAPKRIALWGMVVFMLIVRLVIWTAMTFAPDKVHGAELGLVLASVIIAASHIFIVLQAIRRA